MTQSKDTFDDKNCYTLPDGNCVGEGPCMHDAPSDGCKNCAKDDHQFCLKPASCACAMRGHHPKTTDATFEEEVAITALLRLGYVIGVNDEDGEPHRICDEGEGRLFTEGFYGASIVDHADACRELIAKRKQVCG